MTRLPEWLSHRASLSPTRLAVICDDRRLSYAELEQEVSWLAGGLRERGIREGDRVAVLCRNGLPFVELIHAVPRAGAILVPLNIRLSPAEIRRQIRDVGASLLVHDEEHRKQAERAWPEGARVPTDGLVVDRAVTGVPEPVPLDRIHSIIFTSGTTGRAKGAILTHGNFWHSTTASALNLGHDPDDRWLGVLPLFHVGGMSVVLRAAISGITAIVPARFDPAAANQAIEHDRATIASVVTAMLDRMLAEHEGRRYPATLRCVLLGGGPAPLPLLQRCLDLGVPVAQTYGLTETASQACTLAPGDGLARVGSAGKPLMTTEIRIDIAGAEAAPGESGEIVVRGATVTPGYWNQPEASAQALRDGWLHTGDLGYRDADGYLYVLDRREDLIVSGGENIYPAEIESVLVAHPSVVEAGVFPLADQRWGQVPAAAVVCRADVEEDELRAFCRERLAAFKVPVRFVKVSALPRNAGGKVLRRELPSLFDA
jgi:O-succinylbenzoic acid--CoA ligase